MVPPMGDPHTRGGFEPLNRPPSATTKVTLNLTRYKGPAIPGARSTQWLEDVALGLKVCVGREWFERNDAGVQREQEGTHISVSHPDRYPTWDELVAVKRAFAPHLEMAIYLPRDEDYVNVHENCFHMWEV